jgi:hypothetical protein
MDLKTEEIDRGLTARWKGEAAYNQLTYKLIEALSKKLMQMFEINSELMGDRSVDYSTQDNSKKDQFSNDWVKRILKIQKVLMQAEQDINKKSISISSASARLCKALMNRLNDSEQVRVPIKTTMPINLQD